MWNMTKTHHVRVLHPVHAVPVSQVRVPLLVIVAGVRGLVSVSCRGGIHWKTHRQSQVMLCNSYIQWSHSGVREWIYVSGCFTSGLHISSWFRAQREVCENSISHNKSRTLIHTSRNVRHMRTSTWHDDSAHRLSHDRMLSGAVWLKVHKLQCWPESGQTDRNVLSHELMER